MAKEIITIFCYSKGIEYEYKGRLLGLVTEEQFRDLIRNHEIQSSLITSEHLPFETLAEIAKNDEEYIKDKRIVMSVRNKGREYTSGMLFATQVLATISYYDPTTNTIGIESKDDDYISIEKEV
jgi:hypothetical protein